MKDLEVFKEQEIKIYLVDNACIFCKSYKYSKAKNKLIKAQIKEILDAKLIDFFNEKYESVM